MRYSILVVILVRLSNVVAIGVKTTGPGTVYSDRTGSDSRLAPKSIGHVSVERNKNSEDVSQRAPSEDAKNLGDALGSRQSLLGTIDNKDIYFSKSKVFESDKTTLKSVLDLLLRHKIMNTDPDIPKPIKWIVDTMMNILEYMFNRFNQFLGKDPDWWNPPDGFGRPHSLGLPPTGDRKDEFWDYVDIGIDNGRSKRSLTKPQVYKRWDISSDEAHLGANKFNNRAIIHDDLRNHMLANGIHNLTFLHLSKRSSDIPLLIYRRDDVLHYHWRPLNTVKPAKRPTPLRKHFPYFDANGAGFKISLDVLADPTTKTTPFDKNGIKAVADLIAKDYFAKRQTASAVGYKEVDRRTKRTEGRMCLIAEGREFDLASETHLCFGKNEG